MAHDFRFSRFPHGRSTRLLSKAAEEDAAAEKKVAETAGEELKEKEVDLDKGAAKEDEGEEEVVSGASGGVASADEEELNLSGSGRPAEPELTFTPVNAEVPFTPVIAELTANPFNTADVVPPAASPPPPPTPRAASTPAAEVPRKKKRRPAEDAEWTRESPPQSAARPLKKQKRLQEAPTPPRGRGVPQSYLALLEAAEEAAADDTVGTHASSSPFSGAFRLVVPLAELAYTPPFIFASAVNYAPPPAHVAPVSIPTNPSISSPNSSPFISPPLLPFVSSAAAAEVPPGKLEVSEPDEPLLRAPTSTAVSVDPSIILSQHFPVMAVPNSAGEIGASGKI